MKTLTACQTIAEWVSELTIENVPSSVYQAGLQSWVDVIGCMLGGSKIKAVEKLHDLTRTQHGNGKCSIVGTDDQTSAMGAALANGAAAHALDFDDTSYAGVVHASATVAAAVIAAAEHADIDGKTTFTAFIAGLEAEYAYGQAASNQLFMDGWWTTSVFGGLGAAAGAAKALGLNAAQTASAIAHALCRVSGLRVANGTDAKFIGNGQAASLGVASAFFGAANISSPLNALEGPNGMAELIKRGTLDLKAFEKLGNSWSLIEPGVYLKPFPACSASHAAAEAMMQLLTEQNLSHSDILRVDVEAPKIVIDSLVYADPDRVPQGQFSMQFILACVILDRNFEVSRISADALEDPAIRRLMPKITLRHDPELTIQSEAGEVGPECARVRLTTNPGKIFELFNSESIGAPNKPMSNQRINSKFLDLAAFAGYEPYSEALLMRVREIDTLKSCRDLWVN